MKARRECGQVLLPTRITSTRSASPARNTRANPPPGTLWVYHTSDTYVLGTAMRHFVADKQGAAADFYSDVLVKESVGPLKLSPAVSVTRRTYDTVAQPFTGYGLTLHRDDIVKLAAFLSVDEGRIDGKPMLDAGMLEGRDAEGSGRSRAAGQHG